MRIAQRLRWYDVVSGIEVEQRHHDGDDRDGSAGNAREAVRRAFLLLDEFLRFAQRLVGNRALRRQSRIGDFRRGRPRSRLALIGHAWSSRTPPPVRSPPLS